MGKEISSEYLVKGRGSLQPRDGQEERICNFSILVQLISLNRWHLLKLEIELHVISRLIRFSIKKTRGKEYMRAKEILWNMQFFRFNQGVCLHQLTQLYN